MRGFPQMQRIGEIHAALRRLRHYGDDRRFFDGDARQVAEGAQGLGHVLALVTMGAIRRA